MITQERATRTLERLRDLVSIETPTGSSDGLTTAQKLVRSWVDPTIHDAGVTETVGGVTHLLWRGGDSPRVLLLAHLDTVFPAGTIRTRPFHVAGDRATGPGVFDMKAGIVILAEALDLLRGTTDVAVLLTSDEEIGSPTSRALIEREARRAGSVLVLEPSLDGAVKTARKGAGIYRLEMRGRAAHAGLEPWAGRSALVELAHQVLAVQMLADEHHGTTVSPTVAHAGTGTNVIPDFAELNVDVRAWTAEELQRVDAALRALPPKTPDVAVQISGEVNRPPLEQSASAELLRRARAVARDLGQAPIETASAGGSSDGNFAASVGAQTLDGLGPDGGGAHSVDEWVSVASVMERIELVAGLIDSIRQPAG